MKKNIFLIILPIFLIISCSQSNFTNTITKKTDILPVLLVSMSDSVKVGQPVSITLRAVGYSSCWKNLRQSMRQPTDNHILFTAKGDFESYGSCNDILIEKDSIFNFTLPKAGKYYIQLNESPLKVKTDSIQIIN